MTYVVCKISDASITVKISGHAGYDEHGKDIVCSAVSILSYTLAHAVTENADCFADAAVVMRPGYVQITAAPLSTDAAKVIRCICKGYELLAETYPQNVSWNIS